MSLSASRPLHHRSIEAIFFDIGDTLVTDEPGMEYRILTAAARCGIEFDRDRLSTALRRVEEHALEAYVDGVTIDDPDVMLRTAKRLLAELGASTSRAVDLVRAFAETPFERVLEPRALSLIDALRSRGFKIGIISDWDAGLPELLDGWGLSTRVDAVAVSAVVGCTKPDPRLFRHALTEAGVDAGSSVHIGDYYQLDVAGARAAGMEAVLFDRYGRRPEVDCVLVTSFEELEDCLTALPSPRNPPRLAGGASLT